MEGTRVRQGSELEVAMEGERSDLARELRERRRLLRWSQAQLARTARISRTVINEVEAGSRVPSLRTYARLRAALGLEPPPAAVLPKRLPLQLSDELLAALGAGIVARQRLPLAELASALTISVAAVRENLDRVAERLRALGYTLTEDGGEVRLWPLPGRPCEVVRCLTVTEEMVQPSPEQAAILGLVAYFGPLTRADIERIRGGDADGVDSASLLDRMVRHGLLAKVRSERGIGAPNVYSVTTKALRAAGYPTVEALREAIARQFTPQQLAVIGNTVQRSGA